MLGRLRRARRCVEQQLKEPVLAASVFTTYDPERMAGLFALGLGTAGGVGGGGAVVGTAVGEIIDWGRRERLRYASLPVKAFVAVTGGAVHVYRWSSGKVIGQQVAQWNADTFVAKIRRHRLYSELDVLVLPAVGKPALLSTRGGVLHREARDAWPR